VNCSISAELGEYLGRGGFSSVYAAEVTSAGRTLKNMCVKIYRTGDEDAWANEVKVLNTLDGCPNIIGFHGVFPIYVLNSVLKPRVHHCTIMTRYAGSVHDLTRMARDLGRGLPSEICTHVMRSMGRALEFMHSHGVIHGDVKPANMLLTTDLESICAGAPFDVVLSDFGGSTIGEPDPAEQPGTYPYMAPEILLEQPFDASTDIWSLCASLFEMITTDVMMEVEPPEDDDNEEEGESENDDDESEEDEEEDGESEEEGESEDDESEEGESDEPTDEQSSDEGETVQSATGSHADFDPWAYMAKIVDIIQPTSDDLAVMLAADKYDESHKHYYADRMERQSHIARIMSLPTTSSIVNELQRECEFMPQTVTELATHISRGMQWNPELRCTASDIVSITLPTW
jgi:serine/threonine protein kinase